MTLLQAVRHIYRNHPMQESAGALVPWTALLLAEHLIALGQTYVALATGRGQEVWPTSAWAIARFGLVPALALAFALVAAILLLAWVDRPCGVELRDALGLAANVGP